MRRNETRRISERDELSIRGAETQAAGIAPGSLQVNSSELRLRVRSKSKLRVGQDDSLRAVNKTKLRFRYDLELAGGQKIQLRARASLKQTAWRSENGDTETKTRVKFQFSLIQQEVSEGLSPLQIGDGESSPLSAFLNIVDEAVSDFSDDGTIDADTLIGTVLDEFNTLLASLAGEAPTASDVIDAPAVRDPAPESPPIDNLPLSIPSAVESESESDAVESQPVDNAPSELIEPPRVADSSQLAEADPPGPATVDLGESQLNAPEVTEQTAKEVLESVRIRFIQSFSQVIKTLSPDGEGEPRFSLVQKQNFRLNASFHFASQGTAGSLTDFVA